jgi:hypothetical protein
LTSLDFGQWENGTNWYNEAIALQKAANRIREAYLEAYNHIAVPVRSGYSGTPGKIDQSKISDLDQYPIAMLLMGYAMENIFRGIIICNAWLEDPNSLDDVQNFDAFHVPTKGGTDKMLLTKHGLRRLLDAKAMTIKFSEDEKTMMDTLDEFIIWAGRYPTPKRYETSVELIIKKSEPIKYTFQNLDSLYAKGIEELDRLCKLTADKSAGDELAEGRITRFNIKIKSYQPFFEHIKIMPDQEWIILQLKQMKIHPSEIKSIMRIECSDSTKLFDENGKEITTLLYLLNSMVPDEMEEMQPTNITHTFDKPTFIKTQDTRIPKVKIKAIQVVISKKLAEIETV